MEGAVPKGSRWQGLLCAVPIAALAIVVLELTRLPAHALDAPRLLAALANLVESALVELAIPGALIGAAAFVVRWIERGAPVHAHAALAALGIGLVAHARWVISGHEPFEWSLLFNAGFVVCAIAAGAGLSWIAIGSGGRSTIAGVLLAIVSLVVARAHYAVLVGQYPTLHACALQLSFLGLAFGLALVSLRRPSFARVPAIAIAPIAVLAVLDLPAAAWARPYVVAYTELGRAADVARALDRDREHLLPGDLPGETRLAPDDDARDRFARHSGLPAIDDLALADYDVLLVMSDATRFDRTRDMRSLARLEAHGAFVHSRAFSPSNGTFTSLASILAMAPVSLAELDVEPRFWRGRLRSERLTAVEAMRRGGRDTFWVGHDHKECFSAHIRGLEQGFDERVLVNEQPGDPSTDREIADRAIEMIGRQRGRWFGLVFFVSPHDDYLAREGDGTALERYDQEIAFMDAQLGRVLDAVDLDRTIVIFAGDHGEAFGEHGYEHHLTSLFDEQIHVPLVVAIPGREGRSDAPTSVSYVLPWLLLRGGGAERAAAEDALRTGIGPTMRELDGAVVSEMIGRERQEAALIWREHTVIYDVLSDVIRVYDADDAGQAHDLREDRSDLLERFVPRARAYRRLRFDGRRFRFVPEGT
jgi:hypothetical protein